MKQKKINKYKSICKYCEYFLKDLESELLKGQCRSGKIEYSHVVELDGASYMDGEGYAAGFQGSTDLDAHLIG